MKPLFKRLPAIAHSQIFQPLKRTLLTLLFTVPQVPIEYPLLGSISSGGKALAQAQTSCPAGTSPATLEWSPAPNLQAFLSENLSVGGISTTFRFEESSPGEVIDAGETRIDSETYGGIPGPNLRFNIGGNSVPGQSRDDNPVQVGSSATLTIIFAQPVTLASPLTFLDIDRDGTVDPAGRTFQDRVTITAFNGTTPVGVTGTALGTNTRVTNQGNSVLAEGINENAATTQNAGNIQVTPGGAITRIQVLYEPGTEFGPPGQDETIGLARISICPPSIGDTVYNDTNGNSQQDAGETGINNVTLNLIGAGPDGNFGTADDITRTTTTDSNGRYSFPGLPAGNYRVTVNNPSGFTATQTQPNAIALAGQNIDTVDFGFRPLFQGSIGDTVFQDLNGNGEQEPDEVGVSGVRIRLFGPGPDDIINTPDDNQIAEPQFTDNTPNIAIGGRGNYTFNNLPPGIYRVESDTPPGNPPNDRAFLTTGRNPIIVNLAANQNFLNADFGFNMTGFSGNNPGSLGDTVFSDRNGNGEQDSGETGISGVSVNLTGAGPDGQFGTADDITRPAITTDSNGIYRFPDLPAGNYRVSINPPSNLPQVTTGGTQQERNLQPGQTLDNVDFGLRGGAVGAANTALRLVKRITNVFRNGQPVNIANFNTFVDDPNDDDDNILDQAGRPPAGVSQLQTPLQSGDEVEYTISYLAEGDQEFRNVSFCDLIPPETSYSSGEISVNRAGATSLLTNAQDSDQGAFFSALQPLPQPNQCLSQTNTKGAVIVNLGTITPDRNFGFLRFRVRID